MDGDIVRLPPAQAAPDAKANLWQIDLAMRPKGDPRSTGDQVDTMSCDSPSSTLPSSTPSLLSQHDDSEDSDWGDSFDSSSRHERITHDLDLSYRMLRKDDAEDYSFESYQFDGAGDSLRVLPHPKNPCLIENVPAYDDLVAKRRLGRTRLELGGASLDFAYLDVPVPHGVIFNLLQPDTWPLKRRSSDGFFSAWAMLTAAFPSGKTDLVYDELQLMKSCSTTKLGDDEAADYWVHPSVALRLADEYRLLPYVSALLDPADIPAVTAASANGRGSEQITAPPIYSPTTVEISPPPPPASVDELVDQRPGQRYPIDPYGRPNLRLFDPKMSSKHQGIPDDLLVVYNPLNRLRYMQSINSATSVVEPDLTSLVITIVSVMYKEDSDEKQAGASIHLHETSHCSQIYYVDRSRPQTHEQGLLEALFYTLLMIKHLTAADPCLREVRIMTDSLELCDLFGLGRDRLSRKRTDYVESFLEKTDQTLWKDIHEHWTDITEGRAGSLTDVRLWRAGSEHVLLANILAIAEMYRADGRDYWQETEEDQVDPLKPDRVHDDDGNDKATNFHKAIENAVRPHLERTRFENPILHERSWEVVRRWAAETKAGHKQALLHLEELGKEIEDLTNPAETIEVRKLPQERYWNDIAKAMILARAHRDAAAYLSCFMAKHEAWEDPKCVETTTMDVDINTDDEDLIQAVVDMVKADEEPDQAIDQMNCE